jgi:hypothetical protein
MNGSRLKAGMTGGEVAKAKRAYTYFSVMVVLGTTIYEFARNGAFSPNETRGWSDQVRP